MASISDGAALSPDDRRPPAWMLVREGAALLSRFYHSFGGLGERGPEDGAPLMVLPGFLATDHTTLGLQKALAHAGYRVTGWGMGLNRGVTGDTLDHIVERVEAFGQGRPVTLVGWSLGGVYAREVAKTRPDLIEKVVTLGSPFSGNRRSNNAWRLYELVAKHPVDNPPIVTVLEEKPPVPTLAIWSRRDGVVAVSSARGEPGESDHQVELDCTHMGFGVSSRAFPRIVEAIRSF